MVRGEAGLCFSLPSNRISPWSYLWIVNWLPPTISISFLSVINLLCAAIDFLFLRMLFLFCLHCFHEPAGLGLGNVERNAYLRDFLSVSLAL